VGFYIFKNMAENKKSFVLYSDSKGLIDQLPDDIAGRLFKHIFAYVNDEDPISEELILNIAFEPIKTQLKRDLVKWSNQTEQRRQAGLKSAEIRKRNSTEVNERSISSTDNVNVSVNDNVSENVSESVILLKKETKSIFSFERSLIEYGFDKNLVTDWLKVRKTKKATNTQTAFNKFIEEVEQRSCNINEILEICVEKSWSGFKWTWVDNLKQTNTFNNGRVEKTPEQLASDIFNSETARNFRFS
jgi:hypothetical protein